MTIEDRLRRAIDDRTSSVEVDERAGLDRITSRFPTSEDDDVVLLSPRRSRTPLLLAAAAVVIVGLVTGGLLLSGNDDRDRVDIAEGPDPTPPPSSAEPSPAERDAPPEVDDRPSPSDTTGTTTTETTDPAGDGDSTPSSPSESPSGTADPSGTDDSFEQQVVWPRPSSDVRFEDPAAAARSFALYYARFEDPVIGEFRAADSRSGEVPVQPRADGPETLVRVAESPQGEWFVTGSGTADITVDEPTPNGELDCPLTTSGTALAFEGTVQVRIDGYQPDGDRVEMGRGVVTGSGVPPAGPFSGRIDCRFPSDVEDSAVIAYWTDDVSGRLDGPVQIVTLPVGLP